MSLAAQLLEKARETGAMVACAESCTGGMLAVALTDLPGSSALLDRGFVTYTNAAKTQMLGVAQATLAAHGAVSKEVAREMAAGALERSGAGIAIAVTGIAGPGGSEHKPEGRVCFGLALGDRVTVETCEFGALGRHAVRIAARDHALALLLGAMTHDA